MPSSTIGGERPTCDNSNVLDTNWIPQVAALGWLIITCDSTTGQNRMEITAVRENMAKVVAPSQHGRSKIMM